MNKAKTVDEYLEPFPAPVQARLRKLRALVRAVAPEAVESIGYGIPAYAVGKRRIHFAAFQHHLGLYPGSTLAQFKEALAGYKMAKGSVQFPLDQPMPMPLIRKIIRARLLE